MAASIDGMAESKLHESDHLELHGIRCTFRRGILTLYGIVTSFYVRQVAQELIKDLGGIAIIDNQILVDTEAMPVGSSQGNGRCQSPAGPRIKSSRMQ